MEKTANQSTGQGLSYYKSFDGIRGTCCILVMLVHYRFSGFNLPSSIVYIGLHCFFIMSAFLITKNLLRDKERSSNFWQCFKIFYIKRTARIFPVYFFYLAFTLILFLLFHKQLVNTVYDLSVEAKRYGILLLTFTYNFKPLIALLQGHKDYIDYLVYPHLWSLSLEEQFYIVIIFLAWVANRRVLQILTIVFIIVIPIVRIIGYYWISSVTDDEHLKTLMMWQLPMFQFDSFFYGIALTVFDFKKSKKYLYLFVITFCLIAGFGLVNALLSAKQDGVGIFLTLRDDRYFYRNYGFLFMDSLVNFFCVLWFLCVLYFPHRFKIFTNKVIVRFGELTYGLYIFQFLFVPVGLLLAAFLHNRYQLPMAIADIIGVSVYIALNYFFSAFVYEKMEVPIIKYKDVLLKKVYASG